MNGERILCVGNWESDVGYAWWLMERFWEAIAKKYPGRVTIAFKKLRGIPPRLQTCGAEFIEFDFDMKRPDLAEFVRAGGYKHLYLTDKPYNCSAYGDLRKAGVRSIIMHDHMPGERPDATGLRKLAKTISARIRPGADAYIACSPLVLRRFTHSVCLPADRCHLAMNGVDLEVRPEPHDIRAELKLDAGAVIAVSSGRATRYKGIHHIIDAAAEARGTQFIHCGDGPDLPAFKEQAARLGLNNFHFLGMRSDVPRILASANLAVHASSGEGLSLAILEFMRAGLPIIVPNLPTITQTLSANTSALVYPPGDAKALAAHINRLTADEPLRRSLGLEMQREVRNYNIDHTVAAVLAVFDKLRI